MTQTMTLFLYPSLLLNANERLHWRPKARKTADLKTLALACAQHYLVPVKARQHITVTFGFTSKARRDVGNLAPTVKALVDGIVSAGILPDDNDTWVVGPDLRTGEPSTDCGSTPRSLRRTQITITLEDTE